jgi:hypothetical protein
LVASAVVSSTLLSAVASLADPGRAAYELSQQLWAALLPAGSMDER